MDSIESSDLFRIVKVEPNVSDTFHEYRYSKEQYEEEIFRLRRNHDEQIVKLCQELEKSSILIHQMKFELDSTRMILNQKEKQLQNQTQTILIDDLQMKNQTLNIENIQLKSQLIHIQNQYEILFKDMQDAREYLLNLINN